MKFFLLFLLLTVLGCPNSNPKDQTKTNPLPPQGPTNPLPPELCHSKKPLHGTMAEIAANAYSIAVECHLDEMGLRAYAEKHL